MAIYELTIRFDANNDQAAMAVGVGIERDLDVRSIRPGRSRAAIERLAKVVVTRLPETQDAARRQK